jgi:hypothetical protein
MPDGDESLRATVAPAPFTAAVRERFREAVRG